MNEGKKHKVLLVEDDVPLLRMYQFVLEKANCQVVTAIDGQEAIEKAKENQPDLILLDLVLPKKDGFTVLAELKDDPNLRSIPVVCLTVLNQPEDMERAKKLGAADFLVKTELTPEEIVVRVLSYLQPRT